jgi:hypothetical protein
MKKEDLKKKKKEEKERKRIEKIAENFSYQPKKETR